MRNFDVTSSGFGKALFLSALSLSVSSLPLTQALAVDDNALPSGGNVVNGSATLDYSGNRLDVYQGSNRAVIDWSSFNIGQNAAAQFHQPSADAIVVNRVVGANQDPSQILGSLSANGTVFVLDRNGVIFGEGSTVDVGSIVVGTGSIDTNAFMAGDNVLTIDDINQNAAVINNGTITVNEAGLAAFVAPTVVNNGIIQANLGRVALASGVKATVDLYGDKLVEIATDVPLPDSSIRNSGAITAHGGTVLITANAAKEIVDSVINTSGLIDVSSVHEVGGKIILEGAQTEISGTLDASGGAGGGKINIGGGYQGGGNIRHAENVTVKNTARLTANASGADGDGGEVVIWSDGNTQFDGTIEAKGGSHSGKGGIAETSGKVNLGVNGTVDLSGKDGGGEWLLDPSNVSIRASGGNSISSSGGTVNAGSDNYYINASSIQAALNLGNNVTITTTNGAGTQAGNIDFDWAGVNINKTTGADATLTFKANGSIDFTNSIIRSTGGGNKLNIVGWADFDNTGNDGLITAYGTMTSNGGNIYMVGGLDNGANGGVAGDGIGDNYASGGFSASGATLNAQGGNIVIHGSHASNIGVVVQSNANIQTSGNGNITIRGIGSASGYGWTTGALLQSTSNITAQNGSIDITGSATVATGQGVGIMMQTGATVSTTGTTGGNITLTGTRTNAGNNYSNGIQMNGDATRIFTNNGNISITGTGSTPTAGVSANGLFMEDGADIYSTGSGNIDITASGTATTGTVSDITTTGTGTFEIGKSSSTGSITLNANKIELNASGTAIKTTGTTTVKARTASTTIGLGGGAGALNLDDTELGYFSVGRLVIGDSTGATIGDVDIDTLDLTSKNYNLDIYGNDIDLGGVTIGGKNLLVHAMDSGGDTGDLVVSAAIDKSATGTSLLDLRADRNLSALWGAHITASGSAVLNTVLNADRDADQNGGITINSANITTNGGWFVAGGGSGTLWGADGIKGTADDAASTGADNVAAYGNADANQGIYALLSTVTTGAGDVILNGVGHNDPGVWSLSGIWLNLATIESTSGNIKITGIAGNGTNNNGGLTLQNGSAVRSSTGDIAVKGTSGPQTGGWNNYGINILSNSIIESTGTGASAGDILLEGYNFANVGGIAVIDAGVKVVDGNLTMKSYAGAPSNNNVVHMIGAAVVESVGDGNITFETVGGNSASNSILFTTGQNQRIGSSAMTGDITLITNDILDLEAADSIITQGAVYIRPSVNTTSIGLGGGSGTLNIDDTELGAIYAGTKLVIGHSTLAGGDMDIDSWNLSGKNYSVELYGNDIDVGGLTLGTGDVLVQAMHNGGDGGYITHNAAVTKSVAGHSRLTYKSQGGMQVNGYNITASGAATLDTVFWTDYDNAGNDGTFGTYASVYTNGGDIFMTGGLDDGANGGVSGDGIADNAMLDGILWGNTLDAQGGNIVFRSRTIANNGLYIGGATTVRTSGTGNIDIHGSSGASDYGGGVRVDGAGNLIQAENGTIRITGTNNSANAGGQGVRISGGSQIITTGTSGGDIVITGTRSNTISWEGVGVQMDADNTLVSSNAGNITLNGTGGENGWATGIGIDLDGADVTSSTGTITFNGASSKLNGTAIDIRTSGSNTAKIGTATSNSNIVFNADTISLTNAEIKTLATATVKPRTASATIGLGGGSGTLNLDDTELGYFSVGTLIIGDAAFGAGDIDLDSWNLSGKTHNVEVYGNDIDLGGLTLGTGDFLGRAKNNGGDLGEINVSALISKNQASDSLLTLRADDSINIGTASYSNMVSASGAGKLNIILNADRDADLNGRISISNAGITTNGGNLTLGGGLNPLTDYAYGIAGNFTGITLANSQISLGSGTFTANGHGRTGFTGFGKNGILTSFTKIETTSGDVILNGDGGIGTSNVRGVSFGAGGTPGIITTSGNINITGTSQATGGTDNEGIFIAEVPITTTTGTLTMTGSGSFGSAGILLSADSTNAITIGSGAALLTALSGDVIIDKAIRKASGASASLTLRSNDSIVLRQNGDISSTSNALNVVLNSDRDANQSGAISITDAAIDTNGGYFVAGGGSSTLGGGNGILGDGDGTGADDVAAYGTASIGDGIYLSNADINTLGGDLILNGHGYNDLAGSHKGLYAWGGTTLQTTSGDIKLSAVGGDGGMGNIGMYLHYGNGGALVQSITGDITVNATGGTGSFYNGGLRIEKDNSGIAGISSEKGAILVNATGNGHYGLELEGGVIESTGTGSDAATVTVNASGSTDVVINRSYAKIASQKGDIAINGLGTGTALYLNDGASVASTGSAKINITGGGISTNAGATTTIGGASATGDVTLSSNSFILADTNIQSSGIITVKPTNASATIGLGGGAGTLNLSNAELGYFNAGTLIIGDSVLGIGDINIDGWDLTAKSHHVQLFGNDIDIDGLQTGTGNVYLYANNGDITVSGDNISNGSGNLNLLAGEDIIINRSIANGGSGHINAFAGWNSASAITTNALFNINNIVLGATARDIILGVNGAVSSAGTGNSVLLVATDDFINNATAGATAISASNGRYLVYSDNPTDTVKNGLTGKSVYNRDFATSKPSAITANGNRFIYKYQPTLTVTADNISAADASSAAYTYTVSGLINGDSAADALSGTPSVSLGPYVGNTRTIGLSGLTSPENYNISYAGGLLTLMAPPPVTPTTAVDAAKIVVNSVVNIGAQKSAEEESTQQSADARAQSASGALARGKNASCLVSDASTQSCIIN